MSTIDLPTPRPRWWADAACEGDDSWILDRITETETQLMRRVCAACPVQVDCLVAALTEEDRHKGKRCTMRGGLTADERDIPDAVRTILGDDTEWKPREKKIQWEWSEEEDASLAGSTARDDAANAERLGRTVDAVRQRRIRLDKRWAGPQEKAS